MVVGGAVFAGSLWMGYKHKLTKEYARGYTTAEREMELRVEGMAAVAAENTKLLKGRAVANETVLKAKLEHVAAGRASLNSVVDGLRVALDEASLAPPASAASAPADCGEWDRRLRDTLFESKKLHREAAGLLAEGAELLGACAVKLEAEIEWAKLVPTSSAPIEGK